MHRAALLGNLEIAYMSRILLRQLACAAHPVTAVQAYPADDRLSQGSDMRSSSEGGGNGNGGGVLVGWTGVRGWLVWASPAVWGPATYLHGRHPWLLPLWGNPQHNVSKIVSSKPPTQPYGLDGHQTGILFTMGLTVP